MQFIRQLALACASSLSLMACAGAEAAPPAPRTPHAAPLEAYGPLFTTTVDVAGLPRRFLVDTGGGMTVFTSLRPSLQPPPAASSAHR